MERECAQRCHAAQTQGHRLTADAQHVRQHLVRDPRSEDHPVALAGAEGGAQCQQLPCQSLAGIVEGNRLQLPLPSLQAVDDQPNEVFWQSKAG